MDIKQTCNNEAPPESTITVKWWGVLLIILGLFGWLSLTVLAHENRITKIETQFTYIVQSLEKVSNTSDMIRADQIRNIQRADK